MAVDRSCSATPQRPCPTCGCRLYKESGPCAGEDRAPISETEHTNAAPAGGTRAGVLLSAQPGSIPGAEGSTPSAGAATGILSAGESPYSILNEAIDGALAVLDEQDGLAAELRDAQKQAEAALARSSAAEKPVAWRYYLGEYTGPTFTANADDPFVKAGRAVPLYEAIPSASASSARLPDHYWDAQDGLLYNSLDAAKQNGCIESELLPLWTSPVSATRRTEVCGLCDYERIVNDSDSTTHDFHKRDDGLKHCKVCGGGEGSLPTDCPRTKMSESVEASVFAGVLDYQAGQWIVRRASTTGNAK